MKCKECLQKQLKTNCKIGILTLSASDNCGSLLQTYALQLLLKPYGEVKVINFSTESSHKVYDIPSPSWSDKFCMTFSRRQRKKYKNLFRCKEAYQDFRRHQLQMDDVEICPDVLDKIASKYDVIVVGSDQVWNVEMGDFDKAFFLGWTNAKKVAYAPSLGGCDLRFSKNVTRIIEWIKEFEYLSVREESGKICLEEVSDRMVEKVLDPTLVLEEEEWSRLIGEPLVKGNYIFYYSWAYCYEDQLNIVKKESQRLHMPVIVIDSRKWWRRDEKKYGFILSENEGPLAFLNLMYYAEHVYVESFHGMIFAYIFRKNFWLLDSHENLKKIDKRLKEFVDLLNARDRVLTVHNYNTIDMSVRMNYLNNDMLDELKETSRKYIKKALFQEEI